MRLKALRDAYSETAQLMREHGVEHAGELEEIGIECREGSRRAAGEGAADGDMTDAELRELRIGEVEGDVVISMEPWTREFTGEG